MKGGSLSCRKKVRHWLEEKPQNFVSEWSTGRTSLLLEFSVSGVIIWRGKSEGWFQRMGGYQRKFDGVHNITHCLHASMFLNIFYVNRFLRGLFILYF